MKALVFGSLNIDRVYSLSHLPQKGETLTCENYEIHVGGKGLNQSISLCCAGAEVSMAGCVGQDGKFLTDFLQSTGVRTELVRVSDGFSGHAVIEVDPGGQNQMVLYRGANYDIPTAYCDAVLQSCEKDDLLLIQYETAQVRYMMEKAWEKGLKIAWNPSPFTPELCDFPLDKIDFLVLNESEGQSLSGETETEKVLDALLSRMPHGAVILTLGADGAVYADRQTRVHAPAFPVQAVDTTGAGDTFTGYVLWNLLNGASISDALRTASAASAIAVTRPGAAETIPTAEEVHTFLNHMLF